MSLLNMSFSGAVFIIAIMIIRAITINRLPKKTFLVLWILVLLRLLIPFSIPSIFSVYTLISNNISAPAFSEAETDSISQTAQPESPVAAMPGTGQLQQSAPSSVSLPFVIWCIGMIDLAVFFATSYLRCLREFETALPIHCPYVRHWLKEHPLKRRISIKQLDKISSPMTYGIFHPVILMPKSTDWENNKELQYVLMHEYVHVYRFDAVKKLLMIIALCIHWFNPFVWVMYILFNRDIELTCDENVIRILGEQSKSDYSLMLINMETRKSGVLPLCNNFSKNAIEERITAIMKTKKTTIFSLILACLIIFGTTTVFATSAQANNHSSFNVQESAANTETAYQLGAVLSYVDPQDGRAYYSMDDGKTFMTEDEYKEQFPLSDVEWWTYDEYKEWLENEKVQLQSMIGEKGWTGGRGEFIWTQEIVDETIAMYENTLEEIKNGFKVSKTVGGSGDIMLMQGDISESSVSASDFSEYEKFGLKWDDGKKALYYNGKQVRYFFDGADLGAGNGQAVKLEYADRSLEGKIDIYTIRQRINNGDGSYDLMGPLTGLAEYSQKEFDERVLLPASLSAEAEDTVMGYTPNKIEAVTEETTVTEDYTDNEAVYEGSIAGNSSVGTTFADLFAKYKAYGITYVESNDERNVYYYDSLIHNFADLTPDGGAFSFTSTKEGGINIKTVYADGKLCGVEQIEQ